MSKRQKEESKKPKVEGLKPKAKSKKDEEFRSTKNQSAPTEFPNIEDDSFNFGGLPERNMKKNLGCG